MDKSPLAHNESEPRQALSPKVVEEEKSPPSEEQRDDRLLINANEQIRRNMPFKPSFVGSADFSDCSDNPDEDSPEEI